MNYIKTNFEGLFIIEPRVFADDRGYFFESYNKTTEVNSGINYDWVQDNEAFSSKGVFRGLHYQVGEFCQAKLVRVIQGSVQDVVVDLRPKSKTYGQSYSIILSGENKKQFLVPRGFAHGYLVLSDTAVFSYKCDNFYNKDAEGAISYDDSSLGIKWELDQKEFLVSPKDAISPLFGNHREIGVI